LDGLYVCPHKPEDDCTCRKPRLGLLQKTAGELGFNLPNCIVIGDKACDIEMGHAAGALTFLVRTGYGAQVENEAAADFVVDDLAAAAQAIGRLRGLRHRPSVIIRRDCFIFEIHVVSRSLRSPLCNRFRLVHEANAGAFVVHKET
jgi:HAD-hyrolase-like